MRVTTSKSKHALRRVLVLLCALVLLASACGDGSGPGSAAESPESPESSASSEEDSAPSESPLADLIGIPFTDDEAMEDYFADLSRQAEAKTTECMLAQGFEYSPVDYSDLDDLNSIDFDSREYAEQYGFGIASNPFEESFEAAATEGGFQDPNQEYLMSLSPGEQEAYQTALIGDIDFGAGEGFSFEPGGCQGEAYDELFSFARVFEEFEDEFVALEEAYEADPRIVEATSGWGSCMAEAGYNFSDADGAEADVQRRYDTITADPEAFETRPADIDLEDTEGEFFFGPGTLTPEFQARVDELAVEERAIATASWDCNGPLREIEEEVQLEYENKFVNDNGTAIRAALDGE